MKPQPKIITRSGTLTAEMTEFATACRKLAECDIDAGKCGTEWYSWRYDNKHYTVLVTLNKSGLISVLVNKKRKHKYLSQQSQRPASNHGWDR